MSAIAETYKFTVDEFMRVFEAGIFESRDRIELLLVDDTIETFRDSDGSTFRETRVWRQDEAVSPQAFPDVQIAIDAIIPDRAEDE